MSYLLECIHYLLLVIGSVALFKALCALKTFISIILTRVDEKWAEKYGKKSWVIVTGCTQGIGRAFSFEFASLGFNLVLISLYEN